MMRADFGQYMKHLTNAGVAQMYNELPSTKDDNSVSEWVAPSFPPQDMSSPVESAIAVDLMPTYGAVLVGTFLSCILWGVSTFQAYVPPPHLASHGTNLLFYVSGSCIL